MPRIGLAAPPLDRPIRINRESDQGQGLYYLFTAAGKTLLPVQVAHGGGDISLTGSMSWSPDGTVGAYYQLADTASRLDSPGRATFANGFTCHFVYQAGNAPTTANVNFQQPFANGFTNDSFSFSWNHHLATFIQAFAVQNAIGVYTPIQITGPTLSANTWYWITCVWDGALASVYLNGRFNNSAAVASQATAVGTFTVGSDDTVNLTQRFAELRVYERPLFADEVWRLYDPATRYDLYLPLRRDVAYALPALGTPMGKSGGG